MNAGTLEIMLLADLTKLRKDLGDAQSTISSWSTTTNSMVGLVKGAFLGLAGAFSVGAVAAWVKTAIDAADEAHNLGQKIGIATGDIAGMQLAFKQTGVDGAGMQTALTKLSKNVGEGSDVFKRLGIDVNNADGSLKTAKGVLYEVSDRFAGMPDGINKTALATQIFGKSGADLIPMLNAGSAGMKEMAGMADRLGLSISEEAGARADAFNDTLDLMDKGVGGLGNSFMSSLLPSLNSVASGLFKSATQSDYLQQVMGNLGEVVGVVVRGIGGLAVGAIELLSTTMKYLFGVGTALVHLLTGDFKMAINVARDAAQDFVGGLKGAAVAAYDTWTNAGDASVIAAAKSAQAARQQAQASELQAAANKKAEAAAEKAAASAEKAARQAVDDHRKLVESYEKLGDAAEVKTREILYELEAGRKLTEAEKEYIKVMSAVRDGKIALTELERKGTIEKLQAKMAADALAAATAEEAKWMDETAKANQAAAEARVKAIITLQDQVKEQRLANEAIGLNATQLAAREAAMLRDMATALEREAVEKRLADWTGLTSEQYRQQAALLRERAQLTEDGVVIKEAQAAAAEWTKVTDQIGQGLTDSLFRAFEAGRGFFSTLWDGIKNLFKTTALKLMIQPVQQGIGNLFAGLMGQQQPAGAGGMYGGNSLLGSMNSLYSAGSTAYGWAGNAASWASNAYSSASEWASSAYGNYVLGDGGASAATSAAWGNGAGLGGDTLGAMADYGAYDYAAADALATSSNAYAGAEGAASASSAGWASYAGWAAIIAAAVMRGSSDYDKGFTREQAKDTGTVAGYTTYWTSELLSKLGVSDKWADVFGATAVAAIIGHAAPKVEGRNIVGNVGAAGFDGELLQRIVEKGGIFRSDKNYTDRSALDPEIDKLMDDMARDLRDHAEAYGAALGLPVSHLDRITKAIDVDVTSSDAEESAKRISEAMAGYATELFKSFDAYVTPLRRAGETVEQTLQRLLTLQTFSADLNAFGGVFSRIATLSISAREELIGFAGGMDVLMGKVQGFVGAYYSQEEQAALSARALQAQLTAAGLDPATLYSLADFRRIVESQGLDTSADRQRLSDLLSLSQAFAPLGQYLEQAAATEGATRQSLAELAALAPQNAVLGKLLADQAATTTQQQVDAISSVDASVQEVKAAVADLQAGLAAIVDVQQRQLAEERDYYEWIYTGGGGG